MGAKQGLSESARQRGFADVVGTRKQIGVAHFTVLHRTTKTVYNVPVPDNVPIGKKRGLFHEEMRENVKRGKWIVRRNGKRIYSCRFYALCPMHYASIAELPIGEEFFFRFEEARRGVIGRVNAAFAF